MELRSVGAGVLISTIGLGGLEFGPLEGEEPDVERAVGVVRACLEAGINWLDTSENYLRTRNEDLIGEALKRIPEDFLVATRVAPGEGITGGGSGFGHGQVNAACLESLRRLRREVIDVYYLHWPDHTGIPARGNVG